MTARRRNYAAEYARRKAKAKEAGFASERAYKAARRKARIKAADTGVGIKRSYTPQQIADFLDVDFTKTGVKFNERQLHTIKYLREHDPRVFPTLDDNEYWSNYFAGSIYAY